MKKIVNFNEHQSNEEEKVDVRVKDLITFLQKFDPETQVHLDKDGWFNGESTDDKISYLIDDYGIRTGKNYITINN